MLVYAKGGCVFKKDDADRQASEETTIHLQRHHTPCPLHTWAKTLSFSSMYWSAAAKSSCALSVVTVVDPGLLLQRWVFLVRIEQARAHPCCYSMSLTPPSHYLCKCTASWPQTPQSEYWGWGSPPPHAPGSFPQTWHEKHRTMRAAQCDVHKTAAPRP